MVGGVGKPQHATRSANGFFIEAVGRTSRAFGKDYKPFNQYRNSWRVNYGINRDRRRKPVR
jgi:hypothetical protein